MARIFDVDEIYFDELSAGISAGVNFDSTAFFDNAEAAVTSLTMGIDFETETYISNEVLDLDMHLYVYVTENYSNFVDLLQLVPEKFRSSEALQQFLLEAGLQTGTWLGKIDDLQLFLDPYTVPVDQMQYLADLVNLVIVGGDELPTLERRRQLIQVIDWYRMKGSYRSLHYVAYLLNMKLVLWDKYWSVTGGSEINYNNGDFTKEAWWAGSEGENPPDLDDSYRKSSHLGIDIVLDTVSYGTPPATDPYLFRDGGQIDSLMEYGEKVRPAHVVMDYNLSLSGYTDTTGTTYTSPGDILTCGVQLLDLDPFFFDMDDEDEVVDDTYDYVKDDVGEQVGAIVPLHYFDDGEAFDFSETVLLLSITKWKLGTGNKGVNPNTSGFALETVVLSGDIDTITPYVDRVVYEILIPNSEVTGASEFGLYLNDGTTLKIASTFPDVDLILGVQLKIQLTLYRFPL